MAKTFQEFVAEDVERLAPLCDEYDRLAGEGDDSAADDAWDQFTAARGDQYEDLIAVVTEKAPLLDAAADLLAALKRLLSEADDDGITQDGVDAALAAIAKAEGITP